MQLDSVSFHAYQIPLNSEMWEAFLTKWKPVPLSLQMLIDETPPWHCFPNDLWCRCVLNWYSGNGFTASYRTTTGPLEGCGGPLTRDSGTFMAPDIDNSGFFLKSHISSLFLFRNL